MSVGNVGGKYAALMGGKKEKKSNNTSGAGAGTKPKAAKIISLKDTAEKNPAPHATTTDAKKNDVGKKPVAKAPERDLTRRELKTELKTERGASDRHVPRSGIADHTKEKKNEQVAEALEAANEKPSDSMGEKRREFEEREAERKKREEDELKKVTYADYQKTLDAKKAELAELNKAKERKIDAKSFAALTQMKKDDTVEFFKLGKQAEVEKPAATKKAAPAKGKKVEEPVAPAKKNKFKKSADIQVGFFSKPAAQPRQNNFNRDGNRDNRDNRGPRSNFHKNDDKKDDTPAAETTPVEAQEETPAAEATEVAATE